MTDISEKLSAYIDGELSAAEAEEIEAAVAADANLRDELDALVAADRLAQQAFAEIEQEPAPLELAAAIMNAPETAPANIARAPLGWLQATAALFLLLFGGLGGYVAGTSLAPQASAPGWVAAIAEYHAVYAAETRHLVEVPASEADHIQVWLTNSVGVDVRIPDLADNGLTFQGARLLVAAGKPVAQLMYTDDSGMVVALCQIRSDAPQDGFATKTLNGFDLITWGGSDANFVVVGPEGRSDLATVARNASTQV